VYCGPLRLLACEISERCVFTQCHLKAPAAASVHDLKSVCALNFFWRRLRLLACEISEKCVCTEFLLGASAAANE
jgi:hypothetical protein